MKSGFSVYLQSLRTRSSYSIPSSACNAPETVADDSRFNSNPPSSQFVCVFHLRVSVRLPNEGDQILSFPQTNIIRKTKVKPTGLEDSPWTRPREQTQRLPLSVGTCDSEFLLMSKPEHYKSAPTMVEAATLTTREVARASRCLSHWRSHIPRHPMVSIRIARRRRSACMRTQARLSA